MSIENEGGMYSLYCDIVVENIMEDMADALEKAIQLILDISIRKVAVPYDTIHRWENLIKCAREINC